MNWRDIDVWIWAGCLLLLLLEPVFSQSVNSSQNIFGSGSTCACDLIVSFCDTSCCCDTDCSAAELDTFYCNINSLSTSQDVCFSGGDVFSTSLQMCACPDPSLLCVVTNNDPSSLVYGAAVPVTTPSLFSQQLLEHPSPREVWPISQSLFQYGSTSFYHVGDPILQDVDGIPEFFSLPSPLNSLLCHDSNPLTFLSSADIVCVRTISSPSQCTADTPLDAYWSTGINILQYPVNLTAGTTALPPTVPLDVSNTTDLSMPWYSGNVCSNVLQEAVFTFLHNGSGIILGANVTLSLGQVAIANDTPTALLQRFVVNFVKLNETEPLIKRSGNPGYVPGAPLLAGNCTSSYPLQSCAVVFSADSGDWLTLLGSGRSCSGRVNVLFLEDMVTSCQYNVSTEQLFSCGTNFAPLLAPWVNCVGRYGDSSSSDVSQWIPVLNITNTGGLCDVVTSLHMQILFAYTGSVLNPQAVVVGAEVTYGTTNNFSLCRGSRCNGMFTSLTLRTAVTFVDVSSPPTEVLKSTTNIVRHLPYDFLYPFFASRGHSMTASVTAIIVVHLWSVMYVILFYPF